MLRKEKTHQKNYNKIHARFLVDHRSGGHDHPPGSPGAGHSGGSFRRYGVEGENPTDSDYIFAADIQAVVYHAVDSIEGENQRHKSDIGPHPSTRVDAAAATAAYNVLVNKTTSLPARTQPPPPASLLCRFYKPSQKQCR